MKSNKTTLQFFAKDTCDTNYDGKFSFKFFQFLTDICIMDVFLAYSIFKLRLLSAWSCHEHGYGELTEIFASVRVC